VKRIAYSLALFVALVGIAFFYWLSQPLPTSRLGHYSYQVKSADGEVLASRVSKDGYWRLPVSLSSIDPKLIDFLIAYEDKRFYQHLGVDPLALTRAVFDVITSGRVTSGASTLTMQTARLLYPELAKKTVFTKLKQMAMAFRLEYHFSKTEILEAYFTLAPYGGNIEGIEAASQAWLARSPRFLSDREAALFVALPQAPESRRPDRHPNRAEFSTSRVLTAIAPAMGMSQEQLNEARNESLPLRLNSLSREDQHLIDRLMDDKGGVFESTLISDWQAQAKAMLGTRMSAYANTVNGALMIVERGTGRVKAYVGSEQYQNSRRKGAINYLTTQRSPGSTLKPMIYAMALHRNLLTPQSMLKDRAMQVDGYAPTNFDEGFTGQVSLRDALIQSLNIPAIQTLNKLNPRRVEILLSDYLSLGSQSTTDSGLSLAVGGFYLTPEQVMTLYLGMTDQPSPTLHFERQSYSTLQAPLILSHASDALLSLMTQRHPSGRKYIVKTGTSNGKRDAWAINITKEHIILVWIGTPDNETTTDLVGIKAAVPLTHDIISRLGLEEPQNSMFVEQEPAYKPLELQSCPRLIQYPEDDEWLVLSGQRVSIAGSYDRLDWYLNGTRVEPNEGTLSISLPGVNTISARKGNCLTSHSIFVEYR
jgi:penicillin-binding protein 1C